MSVYDPDTFTEGLISELSLFDLPPTQTSVSDVFYEEIRPLSQVTGDSPIEFKISGQNSMDYLDLKGSQLYVKLKVLKADGTAIAKGKVGPANLFLQSLFSTTEVTLQNKATITRNFNPYRAMIQTFLHYGEDAIRTQLTTQGFTLDDADSPSVASPGGTNSGLYDRAKLIEDSKVVSLQGPVCNELFSMNRYLLNSTDVKLKLYRTQNSFCLLSEEAGASYKVEILDMYLLARKVKVNAAVLIAHNHMLKSSNAKYPFTRQECRVQSIAQGSTSFHWDNMFQGQKPTKLVIGFVKAKAVSGTYGTNPFYFENCGITNIGLYADGLPVGGSPLKLDFDTTKGADTMRAYTKLLINAGKWQEDAGTLLDRDRFIAGSTLFVFQLEPEFAHHGNYLSLVKTGQVRLDVQFKTGLSGKFK